MSLSKTLMYSPTCPVYYVCILAVSMHPDLNQIDTVLQEFDNILLPNLMPENVQTLLDAASLLWRFNVSFI